MTFRIQVRNTRSHQPYQTRFETQDRVSAGNYWSFFKVGGPFRARLLINDDVLEVRP